MKTLLISILTLFTLSACTSHDRPRHRHPGKGMMMRGPMSPEMHRNMAKMHEKMASCLETKSREECHTEIMAEYHDKICPHKGKNQCNPESCHLNTSDEKNE